MEIKINHFQINQRRPHSHPNQHTEKEIRNIINYKAKNKNKGLVMFWLKLRKKTGYSRSIVSLYRVMIRLGIYKKTPSKKKQPEIENISKQHILEKRFRQM